jgi:hypothetical protein
MIYTKDPGLRRIWKSEWEHVGGWKSQVPLWRFDMLLHMFISVLGRGKPVYLMDAPIVPTLERNLTS